MTQELNSLLYIHIIFIGKEKEVKDEQKERRESTHLLAGSKQLRETTNL